MHFPFLIKTGSTWNVRVHISIYVSLREAVSSRSLLRIKLWPPQAHLGQFKPIWANLCLLETNSRPTWGQFGPTWANLGSTWGKLGASLGQDREKIQNQKQSKENREPKILVIFHGASASGAPERGQADKCRVYTLIMLTMFLLLAFYIYIYICTCTNMAYDH